MARVIALIALAALGLSGDPVHEPVHAPKAPPSRGLRRPATARGFDSFVLPARLQEVCLQTAYALAAPMAQSIALRTPAVLGLSGAPVHEPFNADGQRPLGRQPSIVTRTGRSGAAILTAWFARTAEWIVTLPNRLNLESSRGRGRPAPSRTTGHAGPNPAVRQAAGLRRCQVWLRLFRPRWFQ